MNDIERMIQALESGKPIKLVWRRPPGWAEKELKEIRFLTAELQKIIDAQHHKRNDDKPHERLN